MMNKYGLLGEKLSHSISPRIQSEFGVSSYSLFCKKKDELYEFFSDENISGFNVTIPYKIEAYKRCDFLSETAQKTGSVNTVVRKEKLYGYNTDVFGFEYAAKKSGLSFNQKKVLILGSGGASKSVEFSAQKNGAKEVIIVSRNGKDNYENISKHFDSEIIINATPVGMFPDTGKSLIDLSKFYNAEFVFDLIYNPLKTKLVLDAEKLGIPCSNGLLMLVAQAYRSAELFLNQRIDEAFIEKTYKKILSEQKNIVLIGMPSCGKTTVGKKIAEILQKDFVDTDEEIVKNTNKKIEETFSENGEDFFRKTEAEIIKKISKKSGQIIATGGGAVLKEENRNALAQNGVIVYLKRDFSLASFSGRPLMKNEDDLKKLYACRKEIYENFAEITVESDCEIEVVARKVIECVFL